jgi:hypothetical protein
MGLIDGHLFGAEDAGKSARRRDRREAAARRNQARQASGVCNCGNDPNCQVCHGTGSVWI